MREIKFRIWNKGTKQMLFSYEPDEQEKREYIPFEFGIGYSHWEMTDLSGLMQYTGLKDKRGKAIYEGDIVTCLRDIGDKNEEYDYVVELDLESPSFLRFIDDGMYLCEVIGNIYEHPELIPIKR